MNKIKQLLIGAAMVSVPFTGFALNVSAAPELQENLTTIKDETGLETQTDPIAVVGSIIKIFLGFLGVVFLILMIWAGVTWMTAMGDEKKVTTAKNIMISAVVGLLVILASYAITGFVIDNLNNAIDGTA